MRRSSAVLLSFLCAVPLAGEGALEVQLTARAALRDGGWIAAGTRAMDGGTELVLVAERDGAFSVLPVPGARRGRVRHDPRPLMAAGDLAGLAWLEGDDGRSFAVRFARWDGEAWEAPRTVAPPGPGSQVALAAARLADASWLLVWSRYDGEDDEIVWSRSSDPEGASWSRPRPIAADNAVPDITPALAAAPRGAVAAWSRYDGEDYRVVTARFDGRRWSAPRVVGPAGSLEPSWLESADGTPDLVVRTAQPRGRAVVPWEKVR